MPSQTRDEDQVMEDAPVNGQDGELPVGEEEEEPEKQRIRVVRYCTYSCSTDRRAYLT